MINEKSQKIFNNSLLYSLGMVASKAVGFFLVPIYTYNMSKADYGIATTITTFVSTFGIVVMLSLRAAMIRFYNDYSEEEKPRFIGTIVSFIMANAVLVCTLLCLFNRLYMPFLFKDVDFFPCVFFGVLSLGAEGIYLAYQSLLQAKQDGKGYSVNSIIYLFLHAVAVLVFVPWLKMGALGMVLSNFATNICFAVYGIWSMCRRGYMVFCWDRKILKGSLRYSLPILPHNLSTNLSTYSIKVIINTFLTYALSGLYSLAAQFSTIINLVQSSVNLAFRSWFVEQMQCGEEGRAQIKHMSCMIMALFSFCAVGISLFSKEIVAIMAEESYLDAWKMIPFFIITQLIAFIYFSHVQSLMYNVKMSKFTFICSLSGLAVNVAVALILVKPLHIYGILIAQVVSQLVMAALTVVMSRRAEKVDFGLPKMILYIIEAALLMVAGMWVSMYRVNKIDFIAILLKLALLALAFLLLIFPYINDFKQLIAGLFHKKKKSARE